jgi:PAS domain-containing protein
MQISWIMICAPVFALAAVVRERKFVTLAFLKSESRFKQFFETQPECCYMISPGGFVLDVNPAAREALGYTKEGTDRQGGVNHLRSRVARQNARSA